MKAEFQDLDKIVGIADFMLCKYADKKDLGSILKYFVSIISDTANSLNDLDDEISELIISAEDSINKVKEMHTHMLIMSNCHSACTLRVKFDGFRSIFACCVF